jgi:Flp pilus assembly protein TadG
MFRSRSAPNGRFRLAAMVRDRRGVAAIEFGLAGTFFLGALLGVVTFSYLFWTYGSLQYAVEQAARCAVIGNASCATTSEIQSYAASQVYGQTVSASIFTVSYPSCGTQITANFPFSLILPGLPADSIVLTATACRPS